MVSWRVLRRPNEDCKVAEDVAYSALAACAAVLVTTRRLQTFFLFMNSCLWCWNKVDMRVMPAAQGTMNNIRQYEIAFFGGQAPWEHDKSNC